MEPHSCSTGCDNDKALCTLECRCFDGAGRVVCRQCINAMVTLTGKLKCPICRVEVEKFNFTQTVSVATLQRKRNRERAALGLDAGADDRDEEELEEPRWRVAYVAGIDASADPRDEVKYLVVWHTDETVAPEISWEPASQVAGVNVNEFHARFNVPPVQSFLFPRPVKFSHPAPEKVQTADGTVAFKCPVAGCGHQHSKRSNVMQHAADKHMEGSAGQFLTCTECNTRCSNKANLAKHWRNQHGWKLNSA